MRRGRKDSLYCPKIIISHSSNTLLDLLGEEDNLSIVDRFKWLYVLY